MQYNVEEVARRQGGSKKVQRPDFNMVELANSAPKDYRVKPSEILIQCLYRPQEAIHPQIIASSYQWLEHGTAFQRIMDPFGGWVAVSRNFMLKQFIDRKQFKYLLMIDSDEAVPWWAPYALAEHDLPLVSGVVCGYTAERGLFVCVAVKGNDGKARFPQLNQTKTIPEKGVQRVHNAGTGALMIRRDVAEALWAEYEKNPAFGQPFTIPQAELEQGAIQGALPRGEDIVFTDRCRDLGFEPHVDWQVKIGHQKPLLLGWPPKAVTSLPPQAWARMAWPGLGVDEVAQPQDPAAEGAVPSKAKAPARPKKKRPRKRRGK